MAAGNLKAANEQMRSLPPPHDARGKAHLETLQRELAGQLSDPHDASQHIKVVLSGAATDVSKSNTIESFAAKNETKGSGMVSCILREFALRLNPSDQNIRFNLAHKLADYRFSSAVAFEQYDRVRASPSPLGPNATHNMGVIASSRGIPALMYKLYEEAENKGVVLSSINLAATITALGNLREARQILEKIKDASTYRQNYDSARQRLSNAEEKLVQDEKSLKAAAKNAHTEFSRFSEMCVRSWLENHDLKTGVYSLASKGLTVRVDNQEAASMSLMRNDKVEEGILHSNGVCFEGQMSQKGTTAGPLSRSLLATPSDADGDDLLVLLWGGPLSTEPVELMTLVKER